MPQMVSSYADTQVLIRRQQPSDPGAKEDQASGGCQPLLTRQNKGLTPPARRAFANLPYRGNNRARAVPFSSLWASGIYDKEKTPRPEGRKGSEPYSPTVGVRHSPTGPNSLPVATKQPRL